MISGFITVRTSSTRLKNKCLLPFGQESTVLEHIINRTKIYGIDPIVCTSLDSSDDIIEEIAIKCNVKYFRGSLNNKLKRWLDCANFFKLESFHTVDADDPFFNGIEMIDSMNILKNENLDFVSPSKYSSMGGGSVGYSIRKTLIETALKGIDDNTDTEMMWYLLEKVPNVKTKIMENPSYVNNDTPQYRLTLDFDEDYWLLSSIARIIGNYESTDSVYDLLRLNPDLYKINFFKNMEWKTAQINKGLDL